MTVPTPEHDKLTKALAAPRADILADFIDYLGSLDVRFGSYPKPCASYEQFEEDGKDECEDGYTIGEDVYSGGHWTEGGEAFHANPEKLYPVGGERVFSQWIAGFYGIDYKAFQAEKEAIYQEIARAANA